MILRHCLLLSSFVLWALPAWNSPIDVESSIVSVEVYQGQARVTRSFSVDLEAGAHTLRFRGLPSSAQMGTVQLEVDERRMHLGRLTHDSRFTPDDESALLRELRQNLETLEAEKNRLAHERKLVQAFADHQGELLKSIRDGIRESGSRDLYELAREAWQEAETAQRTAFDTTASLDSAIRELDVRINEARTHYRERLNQEQRAPIKLMVEVQAASGQTEGTLTYVVNGPRWNPLYLVRAQPESSTVELSYQASIQQSTGEDWDNVTLSLSTGRPAMGGSPRDPHPIFLKKWEDTFELHAFSAKSAPARGRVMAAAEMEMAVAADLSPPPVAEITASTIGFQATLPGKVTVLSNASAAVLPVLQESVQSEFWSVTVPSTAESAFLVTKFDNPFALPILAGEVQLQVDGRLSGSGRLPQTLPGQELELGLGENPNIEVKRIILAEDTSRSGIISRTRQEERRFRIEVTNRMPIAQKLVIKDSVPISRDERIRVELRAPRNITPEEDTGIFQWEKILQPGESAEFITHYVVSYPQDWQITGGF